MAKTKKNAIKDKKPSPSPKRRSLRLEWITGSASPTIKPESQTAESHPVKVERVTKTRASSVKPVKDSKKIKAEPEAVKKSKPKPRRRRAHLPWKDYGQKGAHPHDGGKLVYPLAAKLAREAGAVQTELAILIDTPGSGYYTCW